MKRTTMLFKAFSSPEFEAKTRRFVTKRRNFQDYNLISKNVSYLNIHAGNRCFIIGNGPSLKKVDLSRLKDEYTITVNQSPRMDNFKDIHTTYHLWVDERFFHLERNNPNDMELLLTINIQDGVLRFSLGADREKTAQVFSYGVKLVGVSSLLICIFAWVNQYFCWVKIFAEYPLFFVLLYITTSYNQIFMNIARGVDRVADVSIAGVISALTGCLLNIWLLVFVKIGLNGYFIAAIGTALAPCIYLGFRLHLGNYLRRNTDEQLRKDMLAYSAPLLSVLVWLYRGEAKQIVRKIKKAA